MSVDCNVLSLPEDKLPECWKDEARMNVLFAPLRNRSVNPQDWNSKLTFWSEIIHTYCTHNKLYSFTLTDLNKIFIRGGRSPSCLSAVVEEMYKAGQLRTGEEFFQKSQHSWGAWAADVLLKKPVMWSFRKIKNSLTPNDKEVIYIHTGSVNINAEKLLTSLPDNYKNKVISLEELIETTEYNKNDVENLKILLHHLTNKGNVDIYEVSNSNTDDQSKLSGCLLKFSNSKVKPITEVDIGIRTLEQTEGMLLKSIEKLESESFGVVEEAKLYLKKGHKQMAKSSLRKKREIEKTITKRANALSNVQTLLGQIRGVDSDNEVFETYKLALNSLRNTLKDKNLTEDSVSDTMVELGEVLDIHNDIQAALAQSISGNDSDLEEELEELINSSKSTPTLPPLQTPPKNIPEEQDELLERLNSLRFDPAPIDTSTTSVKSRVSLT